jgi:hypothetical protein
MPVCLGAAREEFAAAVPPQLCKVGFQEEKLLAQKAAWISRRSSIIHLPPRQLAAIEILHREKINSLIRILVKSEWKLFASFLWNVRVFVYT